MLSFYPIAYFIFIPRFAARAGIERESIMSRNDWRRIALLVLVAVGIALLYVGDALVTTIAIVLIGLSQAILRRLPEEDLGGTLDQVDMKEILPDEEPKQMRNLKSQSMGR